MCGIAGVLLSSPSVRRPHFGALPGMLERLRHRGPDGVGVWIGQEAGVALDLRRLAIADRPDSARQCETDGLAWMQPTLYTAKARIVVGDGRSLPINGGGLIRGTRPDRATMLTEVTALNSDGLISNAFNQLATDPGYQAIRGGGAAPRLRTGSGPGRPAALCQTGRTSCPDAAAGAAHKAPPRPGKSA
jgi:hypothetical protein